MRTRLVRPLPTVRPSGPAPGRSARASVRRWGAAAVLSLLALAAAGCASDDALPVAAAHAPAAAAPAPALAVAHVVPTQGNHAHGTLRFEDVAGGVHVTGVIEGLSPNGVHAIHVHECGDCSAPDGMSAGGHFNPGGHQHGAPDAAERHGGDLGNLNADAAGRATIDLVQHGITVAGPGNGVAGRSVIVHAKPDDFVTQPTGNAGGRIGCGVIGVTKPAAPK